MIYLSNTASMINHGDSLTHPVHAVLLNFSVELRQKFVDKGKIPERHLLFEYEDKSGGVEDFVKIKV